MHRVPVQLQKLVLLGHRTNLELALGFQMLELQVPELRKVLALGQVCQIHQKWWQGQELLQTLVLGQNQIDHLMEQALLRRHQAQGPRMHPLEQILFLYSLDCNLRVLILRMICCCIVAWLKSNAR